jgi:hypothetical protein
MLKKISTMLLLAGIFLLAVTVSPVFAAPPEALHIEVLEFPGGVSAPPEPFSASGLAVDSGAVCASGMVADIELAYNDPGGNTITIWALKRFTCGDGSGTFDIRMVVQWDQTTYDTTARWRVVGGTGDYAGLKGQGALVGYSNHPDPGILDVYDGLVH